MPKNLRCYNQVQTYNILGSKQFCNLDEVIVLAEMVVKDPYLDSMLKNEEIN
jgi:hypothetical protein